MYVISQIYVEPNIENVNKINYKLRLLQICEFVFLSAGCSTVIVD